MSTPPPSASPSEGSLPPGAPAPSPTPVATLAREHRRGVVQVAVINTTLPVLVLLSSAGLYPVWLIAVLGALVLAQVGFSVSMYTRLRRLDADASEKQVRRAGRVTLAVFVALGVAANTALLACPLSALIGLR